MAWQRLLFLRDLAPEAFQESKRMRLGKFCADLREQMPTRIARQVEIWSERTTRSPASAPARSGSSAAEMKSANRSGGVRAGKGCERPCAVLR